jgi:predicted anti-sigma-YlaC factor YlaD
MNCHSVTRLLSEAQDRKLTLQEKVPLKMHLVMCSACTNFGHQMQLLRTMSRAYAKGENEALVNSKDTKQTKDSPSTED